MKFLLNTLMLFLGLLTTVNKAEAASLRTRVSDDSQTLTIQVDGKKNGQTIHLNRRYDVTGMNTVQKEILMYRTFKSVGVWLPLHEMPALIFGTLSLVIFITSLLIMRYQARNAPVRIGEQAIRQVVD